MRNLKKVLAVIVVVAFMLTTMIPAFAADSFSYSAEAQKLYDLGLIKGTDPAKFVPDLGAALNREQGIKLIVSLVGKEADALAMSSSEVNAILGTYSDANTVSPWARPYVAYAIKAQLVAGTSATTLGPSDPLLGKAYATLLLRAFGYTISASDYDIATSILVDKGGLSAAQALKFNDAPLNRDAMTGITYAALRAKLSNGKLVIAALVDAKVVTGDAAIAAGVYPELKAQKDADAAAAAAAAQALKDAQDAVAAYVAAPVATTDNITAAVALESTATAKVALVKDATQQADLTAKIAAQKAVVDAAKAKLDAAAKETVAEADAAAAVAAYEAADITTLANVTAAQTLEAPATAKVALVTNTDKAAAFTARIAAQKAVIAAKQSALTVVAVANVSNTNLKELVVTFTKSLNSTTVVAANFIVNSVASDYATLGADQKTVTVGVHTPDQTPPADYALKVTGVKDTDGNKIADYTQNYRAFDYTIPAAQSIAITGPNTFNVVFSEPLDVNNIANGVVLVNNGIYGASVTGVSGNKVSVSVGATLTNGTNYDVKVSGYKDYAGYVMDTTTLTLAYTTDTTPVTASISGTPSQTSVAIKFNKKIATSLNVNNFYQTYSAWKPDSVSTSDNQTYTLTFTTYPIPEGTFNVEVVYNANSTTITDVWTNKMAADAVLPVTIVADKIPPTASISAITAENTVKVLFSEKVYGDAAKDALSASNFALKDSTGAALSTPTISVAPDANVSGNVGYIVTFSSKLAGGVYYLTVKDVVDQSLSANKIVTIDLPFTVTDLTPVQTYSATYVTKGDGNIKYIYVTYGEAMDASAANVSNYRLADGSALPSGSTAATFGSASKILITLPDSSTVAPAASILVGQVSDLAGNKLTALQTTINMTAEAAPYITKVTTVALDTLKIDVMGNLTTISADGFTVGGSVYNPAMISYTTSTDSNGKVHTVVTATLRAESKLANSGSLPSDVEIVANKLKSDTGMYAAAGSFTSNIVDGIAPVTVGDAVYSAGTVAVTFDEPLQLVNATLAATDLTVTVGSTTLVPGVGYTVALNSDNTKLIVTLASVPASGTKVTVASNATVRYIKDASSSANVISAFSKTATVQ